MVAGLFEPFCFTLNTPWVLMDYYCFEEVFNELGRRETITLRTFIRFQLILTVLKTLRCIMMIWQGELQFSSGLQYMVGHPTNVATRERCTCSGYTPPFGFHVINDSLSLMIGEGKVRLHFGRTHLVRNMSIIAFDKFYT